MHAVNVGKKLRFVQEKAKDTVADIIRRRQEAQAKMYAPNENTATVEELQNALMLCWPEIIEHRPRFFVLEKPAQEASQESFVTKYTTLVKLHSLPKIHLIVQGNLFA